jgi:hypothetical protein
MLDKELTNLTLYLSSFAENTHFEKELKFN